MKSFACSLFFFVLLSFAVACGSGTTEGTGSSSSGASTSSSTSSGSSTTLACVLHLTPETPSCQAYEATGADAARTIDQLRAGCVDQSGITANVVDACPTDNVLGGCKSPVKVQGGADVQLFVTNFFYPSTRGGTPLLGPSSQAAVKQQCASDDSEFVASP